MSDTETTPEPETKPDSEHPASDATETGASAPETEASHEAVELLDLEEFDDEDEASEKTPRLKEFLQSSDAPSRYLLILSFVFALLALFCFSFLVFQYVKHRRAAQKTEVVKVETIKVEPTFHQALGEVRITWSDGEMRADLNAECSNLAACEELKDRKIEVRDIAIHVLQDSSRTEILNPAKKAIIRGAIADKLNTLKLSGQVLHVDFTDLTVEVSH